MTRRSISPFERYGTAVSGDASLRIHDYNVGDKLSLLAEQYLGDWRLWRVIADRNQIADVRQIEPGTALIIPARPLETGRYESA